MRFAPPAIRASLGGKLLYAGELDRSTAAHSPSPATSPEPPPSPPSAEPAALRQAMHAGVIDFLVNSLDEALRILKNEIRKREPVSVAVSIAPAGNRAERCSTAASSPTCSRRTFHPRPATPPSPPSSRKARSASPPRHRRRASKFLIWQIPADFAQRPADFDALLLEHLPPSDHATIRWLRQSPRYLGPHSRRLRSLACDEETASKLIDVLGSPLNTEACNRRIGRRDSSAL